MLLKPHSHTNLESEQFVGKMNMFKSKSVSAMPADLRCLVVEVIEARNLVACTKTGDSDPNLSIYLADMAAREIKTESFRTRPQTKTLAPKWFETFTFGAIHLLLSFRFAVPHAHKSFVSTFI